MCCKATSFVTSDVDWNGELIKQVRKQMLDDWLKSCPYVFVDRTNPYGNDEHLKKIIFNISKLKKESEE